MIPLLIAGVSSLGPVAGELTSGGNGPGGTVNIVETGSGLLCPLFNLRVPELTRAHRNVNITIQSSGSRTRIAQAIERIARKTHVVLPLKQVFSTTYMERHTLEE